MLGGAISPPPPHLKVKPAVYVADSETVDVLATRGRKPRSLFTPHSSHSLMTLI